jgi:hypothetical protein
MPKVYFLCMQNAADPAYDFELVKIGITEGDVAARVGHLQTGNPHELRCLKAFETSCASQVEHFIHRTHASQMHNREWLRCRRDDVNRLIQEAQTVADRFEERKAREDAIVSHVSSGMTRRPDRDEVRLHREVRELKYELVPARLRLVAAENQLKAATAATNGIEGVVRVKYVAATIRFSPDRAQSLYPMLADRCSVEELTGGFRWRGVPRRSRFVAEHLAAKQAKALAERGAQDVLCANTRLDGWVDRTIEIERLHDEFLQTTQVVSRLEADLADLKTELTIRMSEFDAIESICSFRRVTQRRIDSERFCDAFPNEAVHCAEPVPARLRKMVYRTRSYV